MEELNKIIAEKGLDPTRVQAQVYEMILNISRGALQHNSPLALEKRALDVVDAAIAIVRTFHSKVTK